MYIIRPINRGDYDALYDIAVESGVGFTSLPVNETLLNRRIDRAERSIRKAVTAPGNESYLFVLEDTTTGEVVGTTGIEASVGLEDAFYHYHIGKVVHASRELNIHNTVETLTFCNDYTGVTEICTLFLKERARKSLNGRFLSKVRFLFMYEHQHRFSDRVIAEMRGVSDEHGRSPFWQWLEEHFFHLDFPTADYLTGIGNKVFIAELMPKYPIYVNLLSKEAQAVIGHVHEKTKPALKLLQEEGFSYRGYVDIFDGGPTVEANLSHIRSAQVSRKLPVVTSAEPIDKATQCYVINTKLEGFRAVIADVHLDKQNQQAVITEQAATALEIQSGEEIRFTPINLTGK